MFECINPKLADDCRYLKTLFNSKDVLDRYRALVLSILKETKMEGIMDKCPIANFRAITRNILALGACLNNSNQFRDWYLMVLEKISEPAAQMNWTVKDLESFMDALNTGIRRSNFDIPEPAILSYSKIVKTLSLSGTRLLPYANVTFVFGF